MTLCAGTLLSGQTYGGIRRAMDYAGVRFIGKTRFYSIQKKYLFPAINHIYEKQKENILYKLKSENIAIDVVGDGRFDSPGFCAKYGTYTIMNAQNNQIIDFFVAHVHNAGNSQRMELYGFCKVINSLINNGITINSIVTDRHTQIRKFLKDHLPNILHQFDVWHFCKNIKKKLCSRAKLKKHEDLQGWIKSITNHFWWSCATCKGDPVLLKEMWVSLLSHVSNEHEWEGFSLYHNCSHGELSDRDIEYKKWLPKNSPTYLALKEIVLDDNILRDLAYLTMFAHSGNLEVFHSLYNVYCPKRLSFSYEGMYARTQLSVLDHNSGIGRNQSTTKDGKLRYKTVSSKVSSSWVAKKIMENKNKSYVDDILSILWEVSSSNITGPKIESVPKNIAKTGYPGKSEVINAHTSRFVCKN